MSTTLIADLIAAGVRLRPDEAVAIAQQLIHAGTSAIGFTPATAALGPPLPGTIRLHADGSVTCDGYDVKPAVFEIAILLQTLLPGEAGHVPGGLRYAIARGLLDVDAPPFDSIHEFSRVLERFERGNRHEAVRGALARSSGQGIVIPFGRPRAVRASIDRRRTSPSLAVLRRELREADRRLYEQRAAAMVVPAPPAIAKRTWRRTHAAAAILVGGMILAGVADLLKVRAPRPGGPTRPAPISSVPSVPVAPPSTPARQPVRPNQPLRPDQMAVQAPPVDRRVLPKPRAVADGRVEPEGQLVRALDGQRRPVFSPAFASNGTAMFFHTGGNHDARSALAMMPASPIDGGDLRVVTIVDDGARNYHVQPSPDGRFIAFDSDRDGDRGVYLAEQDGTHVRRISGPGYAAVPTWAPDGRRVAYVRAEPDRPKVWNLWLQSVEGTEATRLTNYRFGQTWSASWFPDNRRICYTHEDKVIVLDIDTGRTREFGSPVHGRLARTPAVSPDGTKVIFQVFRSGAWILDLNDGSMRCVLTDPTAEEFAWAPDGRRVAFHSRREGQWGIYILHPS